jgi:nucleolin
MNTNESRRFAFVHFEEVSDAGRAVQDAHGQVFAGRRLAVNFAAKKQSATREPGEPSPTLFVGNLAYDITDKELNDMFRPLRNIRDVRVAIDRRTGQPRGFAHADFTDTKSATDAMEKLAGKSIRGRELKVDFSVSHNTRDQAALERQRPGAA